MNKPRGAKTPNNQRPQYLNIGIMLNCVFGSCIISQRCLSEVLPWQEGAACILSRLLSAFGRKPIEFPDAWHLALQGELGRSQSYELGLGRPHHTPGPHKFPGHSPRTRILDLESIRFRIRRDMASTGRKFRRNGDREPVGKANSY